MLAWKQFLEHQEREFGKETVDRWLRPLTIKHFDNTTLYLEAKDSFQALWFEEHIRHKLFGFVNAQKKPIAIKLEVAGTEKKIKKNKPGPKLTEATSILFEELDPTCTFESFVCSEENKITYTLVEELSSQLAASSLQFTKSVNPYKTPFNPLFLYGPPGCGKTHLLIAIAHKLLRAGLKVLYVRADLFTDHVVKSIRSGEMAYFRTIYRTADVLIIDDVQMLAKRVATQEEFFHTFNALHITGKPIFIAAHAPPQSLAHIEPRLISRFEWGLTLPLCLPEKKDLTKLIEKKAQMLSYPLSNRSAEYLSDTFSINPKSAMKALNALVLRSHLGSKNMAIKNALVSPQQIKVVLADLIDKERQQLLTPERILHTVAERYDIRADDLTAKSQSRKFVVPRQIAMYFCRTLLKLPYMKIGDIFSKDHSTVMSSTKLIEKELQLIESDIATKVKAIQIDLQTKRQIEAPQEEIPIEPPAPVL
jgi:chromosomal replication initiator protein